MTSSHSTPAPCQWFSWLATALDRRSAPRLALLFFGAILARGRRTVTTWIRAAGLSDRYQSCYLAVAAAGRKAETIVSTGGVTSPSGWLSSHARKWKGVVNITRGDGIRVMAASMSAG